MKRRKHSLPLALLTITALGLVAVTPEGWARHRDRPVVELGDARLKFEINSTAQDGGVQVFLDADPWKWMKIFDPNGRLIFRSTVRGSIGKQGGTELFLESGEPEFSEQSIEELLELFPQGEYRFKGRGLEGEKLVGTAMLTHSLADGPVLVSPLEGEGLVDPSNAVVTWEPVEDPNGSPIVGYQVLVVSLESNFPAIPKITLDVMMPATATSMAVPPGFLLPDTEYEWEVLAIEASGNQTLSSSFFKTAP
ncbi:MAG: fibronectin type III domain-containing protein [Gammaproteobacteria bacterium]